MATADTALPHPAARPNIARAVKDAAITALVTFALFLPLIGFKTVQNMRNELELETRLPLLFEHRRGHRRHEARSGSLVVEPWRERRAAAPAARERAGHRASRPRFVDVVHAVRDRLRGRLSDLHPGLRRPAGRAQMDRQFRHPDPDLRDARLGPEHRGRPRRPARSRLRRVLRGRRLFVCAARQGVRLLVLDPAAARRHASRRSGASCSAFRCCACAATIWRSSRSRSARSSG